MRRQNAEAGAYFQSPLIQIMTASFQRACAVALLCSAVVAGSFAAQLIRDGRPAGVLVVPEAAPQARTAAERIQKIVAEMSGARLEIVPESAPLPRGLLPVYVGHTRFAASKGIRQQGLKPE